MAKANVLFFKGINPDTATACLHACRSLIGERDGEGKTPWSELLLSISSGGGDVIAALGLYNELKGMQIDLQTHNAGAVDSSAILPFMAGKKRTASKHSAFFFHQIHWTFPSKDQLTMGSITDSTKWLTRYENIMAEIVAEHSSLKPTEVLEMMRNGTSLSSQEALDMKVVHAIEETSLPMGSRTWQA